MKHKKLYALLLGIAVVGCGPAAKLAIRDLDRSKQIQKIAILPFFNANTLSVEFVMKGKRKSPFTTAFTKQMKKTFSNRYELITGEAVEKILLSNTKYKGWVKEDGRKQRTGFTISEAISVGEALGVDAVIIGSGSTNMPPMNKLAKSALAIRLIDVQSKKVIWGASAIKKGGFDSAPWNKITKRLAKEAL